MLQIEGHVTVHKRQESCPIASAGGAVLETTFDESYLEITMLKGILYHLNIRNCQLIDIANERHLILLR